MILSASRHLIELGVRGALEFKLQKSKNPTPEILYAGQLPKENQIASGGAVKLISLGEKFPDSGFTGNILYLVTSSLPKGAVQWAQACRKKGIKVIINQNGVAFPAWAEEKERERINLRNLKLLENADYIFFQSQFCLDAVKKWVGFNPEKSKSEILYNPINLEKFSPTSKPSSLQLLIMGSHHQAIRVERALEALKILKASGVQARLRIAGRLCWSGAEYQIRQKVKVMGLEDEVQITGSYFQNEAVEIYRSANVLLHLQDKDASPTVPLEAMACGLQVIAPQSGGLPEIISPKGGVLLPVEQNWDRFNLPQAKDIAKAIEEVMTRPTLPQEELKKFAVEHWLKKHDEVFKKLLHG